VKYDYGFGTVFISTTQPQPTFTDFEGATPSLVYGRTELLVCPEISYFRPGTFFISFGPITEEASFTIEVITSEEVDPEDATGGNDDKGDAPKCEDEEDRVCLKEGVPYNMAPEQGVFQYFKFLVRAKKGECVNIVGTLLVSDGDGDLYMSFTSRYPNYADVSRSLLFTSLRFASLLISISSQLL